MSYRTSVVAKIFRKIGFYMQLNVLYHLKTSENCFGKKCFFGVKNWFSEKPISLAFH
jgi:hypothetical protein